jgi:hypothetical protein
MRRLVLSLCLFLLPLAAAWGVLEWWMTKVPNVHSVKRAHLEPLKPEIDTLILGASGSFWDIAPQNLTGSAYNLGGAAQTLYYDDRLITQILPQLPKLKRVILTISYVSFFFQMQDSDEEDRQFYYEQVWGIPPQRLQERLDPRMWSAVVLRTPGFAADSLRVALTQAVKAGEFKAAPLDPPVDERGWSAQPHGDPAELEGPAVEKKLMYQHRLMHFSDEAANLSALEHMIALLKQRNVELILVAPPVWHEYAERMKPEFWSRTESLVADLTRTHGLRYLSFLRTPDFTAQDFVDADHLNGQGAGRFTRMLDAAIRQPGPMLSAAKEN